MEKSFKLIIFVIVAIVIIIAGFVLYAILLKSDDIKGCKTEGEIISICGTNDDGVCCSGYRGINPKDSQNENCRINEIGMCGWEICTKKCGNGTCDKIESKCNCPEDCKN